MYRLVDRYLVFPSSTATGTLRELGRAGRAVRAVHKRKRVCESCQKNSRAARRELGRQYVVHSSGQGAIMCLYEAVSSHALVTSSSLVMVFPPDTPSSHCRLFVHLLFLELAVFRKVVAERDLFTATRHELDTTVRFCAWKSCSQSGTDEKE
eukprot:1195901-Prorocentrum_minimum.AAC.6